ncbi:anamorsin homolog [Dysidea avara]|uniref:anamorsin homolog n=1 Tax=Dysidea avara TaxID=196820 RepID=UPI003326864C
MMESLVKDKTVLLAWNNGNSSSCVQDTVTELKKHIGGGHLSLEHVERLQLAGYEDGTFDVILSGVVSPVCLSHITDLLAEYARILKPSGVVVIREPVVDQAGSIPGLRTCQKVQSALKLSGLVGVTQKTHHTSLTDDERSSIRDGLKINNVTVENSAASLLSIVEVQANKPSYEVGASTTLSFSQQVTSNGPNKSSAAIWTLSANDVLDDDIETLDPDSLLSEEDLIKPDPASLQRDCGSSKSGKRRACKNCTCGLAEELDGGTPSTSSSKPASSACGNCYLGDAFRCASCPYLGMPAFKPGEQIKLTERQLNADQ